MSATILNNIVLHKKQEIKAIEQLISISDLENKLKLEQVSNSIIKSITNSKNGIISEFKRRSPSKNNINLTDSVLKVAQNYQNANTAAMSVLTDSQFFGGCMEDLIQAKSIYKNAILRKDFIISEYQIYQSKVIGADVILLIAAILTKQEIEKFCELAKQLNLEVLIEIHDETELQKITFGSHILYGINNRNLKTFEVNFENSIKLSQLLPKNSIKIAESGISTSNDIMELRKNGFSGFLIGELFMKMNFKTNQFQNFIKQIEI